MRYCLLSLVASATSNFQTDILMNRRTFLKHSGVAAVAAPLTCEFTPAPPVRRHLARLRPAPSSHASSPRWLAAALNCPIIGFGAARRFAAKTAATTSSRRACRRESRFIHTGSSARRLFAPSPTRPSAPIALPRWRSRRAAGISSTRSTHNPHIHARLHAQGPLERRTHHPTGVPRTSATPHRQRRPDAPLLRHR